MNLRKKGLTRFVKSKLIQLTMKLEVEIWKGQESFKSIIYSIKYLGDAASGKEKFKR